MNITEKDVAYTAGLARLTLTVEETKAYAHTLNDILAYFDKLQELDTEAVEPTAHVLTIQNVFREDIIQESMDRDRLLQNAPDAEDGCFRVPKIVE